VFRPIIVLLVICYPAVFGFTAAALFAAADAHAGGSYAPMPPRGDWAAVGERLFAGEILVVAVWIFYKVASQRVILGPSALRIVTFWVTWTVDRNEIVDVLPEEWIIRLTDGSSIQPLSRWSLGPRGHYAGALIMRREILRWRWTPQELALTPSADVHRQPPRRRWQVRGDWRLLLVLAALIAAEAAAVTAWA
jgi:hypothetical protein